MKQESVLKVIDQEISISQGEREDFDAKQDFQKSVKESRVKISEAKLIAIQVYEQVKDKLNYLEQISIASAISKLTLSFSHLGTAIKKNRDFSKNIIISDFLKSKAGNIAASTLKDMIKEIVFVLITNPDLVQISNYEKALKTKLLADGWKIGSEYEAKKKELPKEFFGKHLPKLQHDIFAEYIDFRRSFGSPYAMVINSVSDIKSVVDSGIFSNLIDKSKYTNAMGMYLNSFEELNLVQRIDWLRTKISYIMDGLNELDETAGDYQVHLIFASMELHDARVFFGHLFPILK